MKPLLDLFILNNNSTLTIIIFFSCNKLKSLASSFLFVFPLPSPWIAIKLNLIKKKKLANGSTSKSVQFENVGCRLGEHKIGYDRYPILWMYTHTTHTSGNCLFEFDNKE
jgi:hypothetical protein